MSEHHDRLTPTSTEIVAFLYSISSLLVSRRRSSPKRTNALKININSAHPIHRPVVYEDPSSGTVKTMDGTIKLTLQLTWSPTFSGYSNP